MPRKGDKGFKKKLVVHTISEPKMKTSANKKKSTRKIVREIGARKTGSAIERKSGDADETP